MTTIQHSDEWLMPSIARVCHTLPSAPRNDAFTASRLLRRVRATVQGVETWVATAEDIILAKLRWRLTTRSELQWRDCLTIAPMNDLDVDYLRKWADVIGVRDDLEELLEAVKPLR